MTNTTYYICIEITPAALVGASAARYDFNEVLTDRDQVHEELESWKRWHPHTHLLCVCWSALNGVRYGGATSGAYQSAHLFIMNRKVPEKLEAAVLEGVAFAIRIDSGEFGPIEGQSVKGSPKVNEVNDNGK